MFGQIFTEYDWYYYGLVFNKRDIIDSVSCILFYFAW